MGTLSKKAVSMLNLMSLQLQNMIKIVGPDRKLMNQKLRMRHKNNLVQMKKCKQILLVMRM